MLVLGWSLEKDVDKAVYNRHYTQYSSPFQSIEYDIKANAFLQFRLIMQLSNQEQNAF